MKKLVLSIIFLLLIITNVFAATPFYSTEQVLNKVYDTTESALKTTATLSISTMEVTTAPYTNTIFKRVTLTPGIDSGSSLDFGVEVKSWVVLNMADTAEVFIRFDAPAILTDFKIQAGSGIGGNSKVTNIHCISLDAAEVQVIGYY